jgi:hypothetical protein
MSVEFCKRTKRARHFGGNSSSPWIFFGFPVWNTVEQYPLLTIPALPTSNDAPPKAGNIHVCSIDFGFSIFPTGCPPFEHQVIEVAFGVYRSSWDTRTGMWALLDPSSQTDCNRNEWFDLQLEMFQLSNEPTIAIPAQPIRYKADLHIDERLTSGQGIFFGLFVGGVYSPTPGFALAYSVRFALNDMV